MNADMKIQPVNDKAKMKIGMTTSPGVELLPLSSGLIEAEHGGATPGNLTAASL